MKGLVQFVFIVVFLLVFPVAMFVVGAFTGWVAAYIFPFFGGWIIDGFALFGVHLVLSQLPLLTATLGFIGGFFKTYSALK